MNKKSNTEKLKELQDIVDEYNKKKEEVEVLLNIIDELEVKYHKIVKEIKEKK